ncbi:unnamed protein product [Caenorhabditis auriculariae]|uniref:glutathione transferase n=1 Tax=Caenorhabditis auriculariae TaxID=2777116 RepID=A0A8S1GXB8_9PELO|nr:unnamed protein product [Caenorhabditis auriculariae]
METQEEMHKYTLYYFPVRGRGEPIRLLFHLDNQPFADERISLEQWPSYKSSMPLGQIPVLEVDGVKLAQSPAILRFLGHQQRRAGANAIECAKLDMIAEVVQEFSNTEGAGKFGRVLLGMITADKNQYYKEHVVPDLEKYAPIIEKFLVENGNNGLFIGDRETWVDVFSAEVFSKFIEYGSPDALDAYPHIRAQIQRVFNHPNIKRYIASRPVTPF